MKIRFYYSLNFRPEHFSSLIGTPGARVSSHENSPICI